MTSNQLLLAAGLPPNPLKVMVAVPPLGAIWLAGEIPVMVGAMPPAMAFVGTNTNERKAVFAAAVAFVVTVAPGPVS